MVLVTVENVTPVETFAIDRSDYKDVGEWLSVDDVSELKVRRPSPWLRGKRFYNDADLVFDR